MMGNRIKMALILVAAVLLIALVAEFFITLCFPAYLFNGHWVVPVYFLLLYLVALFAMPMRMSGKDFLKFFLGFKAAKMFVSLCFILVAAFVMRGQVPALAFNFLLYYLLLLVPECLYSMYYKKHLH